MIELSVRELEDFIESKPWKAVLEKLEEFLADIHIEMENPKNEFGDYKELSGNAGAIRRVMVIPDVLKHDAEIRLEELKNERRKHDTNG